MRPCRPCGWWSWWWRAEEVGELNSVQFSSIQLSSAQFGSVQFSSVWKSESDKEVTSDSLARFPKNPIVLLVRASELWVALFFRQNKSIVLWLRSLNLRIPLKWLLLLLLLFCSIVPMQLKSSIWLNQTGAWQEKAEKIAYSPSSYRPSAIRLKLHHDRHQEKQQPQKQTNFRKFQTKTICILIRSDNKSPSWKF